MKLHRSMGGEHMALQKNFDGVRFNHITVIRRDFKKKGQWYFLCRCDCGNEIYVSISNLRNKTSCGCMTPQIRSDCQKKHGGKHERLYKVWDGIKFRCNSPSCKNYKAYGGRGIKICPEWKTDYAAFRKWAYENGYDDKAPKGQCTLDRIDVNGDYEPSNCRWANVVTQANNRRTNVYLTYNGEKKTIADWARVSGVPRKTLEHRVRNGWSTEAAIFTKPDRRNKRQ